METKCDLVKVRDYAGIREVSVELAEALINGPITRKGDFILDDPGWEMVEGRLTKKARKKDNKKDKE